MTEPTTGTTSATTSIKVKSPSMLAEMIAWTQADFYPDPRSGDVPAAASADSQRPPAEAVDTVNFSKLDDDNVWSDI